jgi:hypothetical protein
MLTSRRPLKCSLNDRATADQVTDKQLKMGMLCPPQSNILDTEVRTAERVARLVFERDKQEKTHQRTSTLGSEQCSTNQSTQHSYINNTANCHEF